MIDAELAAAERDAGPGGLGPRRRLAVSGRAYLRFALADPGVFSVTFRPERVDVTDPAYQAAGFRSFQQLVDLVAAAQADGWQAGVPTRDLAAVLWANVHGLATLELHGGLGGVAGPGALDRLGPLSSVLVLGPEGDPR